MRLGIHCVLVGSLLISGCEMQVRDLSGLPSDEIARAKMCVGAAHTYWLIGENQEGVPPAERARRNALYERMRKVTEFDDYFTEADEEPFYAERMRQLEGGNWRLDLNSCKAGYDLGAAEPLPTLPADPVDRLFACAASSAIKARGADTDRDINVYYDPQAFHFLMRINQRIGAEELINRAGSVDAATLQVVRDGAVNHVVSQCLEEVPTASLERPVTLPEEEPLRASLCQYVAGVLTEEAPENPMRNRYLPQAARMAIPMRPILESADDKVPTDGEVEMVLAELGPSSSIFGACTQAYLGEPSRA